MPRNFISIVNEPYTPEFLGKYKKRASHEWKNGEMKRFHGMDRARGYGLKSMKIQAKLTVLAVNLKRIANLLSSFHDTMCHYMANGFGLLIALQNERKYAL